MGCELPGAEGEYTKLERGQRYRNWYEKTAGTAGDTGRCLSYVRAGCRCVRRVCGSGVLVRRSIGVQAVRLWRNADRCSELAARECWWLRSMAMSHGGVRWRGC